MVKLCIWATLRIGTNQVVTKLALRYLGEPCGIRTHDTLIKR